jgi:hypothetical protein
MKLARGHDLLSDEYFTSRWHLAGSLGRTEEFQKEASRDPAAGDPGNASVDSRGEQRTSHTHQSTIDPEARLFKKAQGQEARLGYLAICSPRTATAWRSTPA